YVKICTLYGDGFYYVPGTNTCLKLGGYVRVQAEYWAGNGGVTMGSAPGFNGGQAMQGRERTQDFHWRARGVISVDVRDQTEWGTLRSYLRIGQDWTTPGQSNNTGAVAAAGSTVSTANCSSVTGCTTASVTTSSSFIDRAFIQWAGFTVGKAQ